MSAAPLSEIERAWSPLSGILRSPRTDDDYDRLVMLADSIVDHIGENEAHPLAGLLDVVGTLIEAYEDSHLPDCGRV